ncbi:MAG: ferrochelatase [Bacteroidota bacterium]|nr:ferrochelatase [Bacteroidota bacterium]
MNSQNRIAVVLLQLGGPDSLEAIEPFLYNLFCDPDIINFPGAFLARKPIAKFISSRRSKGVIDKYRSIGDKSPITELTKSQAHALELELNKYFPSKVFTAMRYWHPMTDEIIRQIKKDDFKKIILLPMYPQYSTVTSGSSLTEWKRQSLLHAIDKIPSTINHSFHNHPLYIEAMIEKIHIALKQFSLIEEREIDLVFSAHSIPMSIVKKGDPYKNQIQETVQLLTQKGQWKSPHHICYQSKVGPISWLGPSMRETVHHLAAEGRHNLLIIPVSFVSDHIETLYDINIEMRREAERIGIKQFILMPALNDSPKFIECLKALVLGNI